MLSLSLDLSIGRMGKARGVPAWLTALNPAARWGIETVAGGRSYRTDLSCIRASSGMALDLGGIWRPFSADTPRITDAGLLVEPSAINLVRWSNDLTAADWVGTGFLRAKDVAIGPDGLMSAGRLTYPDATAAYTIYQSDAVTPLTQYAFSYWVLLGTKLTNRYSVYNNTANNFIIAETIASGVTSGAWSRVDVSFTTPAGCTSVRVYADRHPANISGPNGNTILLWQQQLVAGPPSSPIDTGATAGARAADANTLTIPPGTYDVTVIFDNNSTQTIAGLSSSWTIPTNLNRRVIKSIYGVPA